MTLSLRKATLTLLGGAGLVIAAAGAASAGTPDGYFAHGRYFGPGAGLPPPAYVEVVPVYPERIYPAPPPVYAAPAPVYQSPDYPPAYAAPDYDPAASAYYEDGYSYGYDPGYDYVEPDDGAIPVGVK